MTFEDLYIKYFRHQAVNHPDLLHQEQEGSRVFDVVDIEEGMLTGIRSGLLPGQYAMRLFHYTYRINRPGAELLKFIQGGFLLAKSFSPRNSSDDEYQTALQDAERVTDEIIEKMISDSLNGHPLFYRSLDSDQDINVVTAPRPTIDGSYAGKICTFTFAQHWINCIDSLDAPDWLDGGITPKIL